MDSRSITRACRGKRQVTWMPGTAVAIGRYMPRNSAGVRFHVVGVLLAQAAVRPEDDERLARSPVARHLRGLNSAQSGPVVLRPRSETLIPRKFRRLRAGSHAASKVGDSLRESLLAGE